MPERYVGLQPVGLGGMGSIYRATDTSLGRAVAIKVLDDRYAQDESVRARFTREALAAARLSGYPNIVTIYDVGEHDDQPFIVMEYLAGGSLEQRLRRDDVVPLRQALEWLEQTASALDAAHREGVIHRDIKPANLLLDQRGHVHVADFGIASAAGLDSLTQTGTVLGTASYLSPEQAMGERATPASDIYSLAIVAFELITGRRPFEGDSVAAEAAAHVTGEIPSVCDVNPHAPCELDPVFAKALAKNPADRYSTAAEFVAALRAALEQAAATIGIVDSEYPTKRVLARQRRTGRLAAIVAVPALVLAGIVAALVLTRGGGGSPNAKPVQLTTVVRRVTEPSQTVVSTSYVTTSVTSTPVTSTPANASFTDPVAENNAAYEMMKQSEYQQALPLLQDAANKLQGQGNLAEAYTDYNLGYTLMRLGNCTSAMTWLQRSLALQPHRSQVGDAIRQARHCASPAKGNGGG